MMIPDHAIDDKTVLSATGLCNDDLFNPRRISAKREPVAQYDVGDQLSAHAYQGMPLPQVRPAFQFDALGNVRHRKHEERAARLHEQSIDNRERERDLEGDHGALPGRAGYRQGPPERIQAALNDVHSDPAARYGGNARRG